MDQATVTLASFNINMLEKSFYLSEAIDEETPKKVFLAINALESIQDDRPIRMYLSTTGGDVEAGLAIYGLLRRLSVELEIVVLGYAYSMGIIILQAADHRVVLEEASLMAHWGHNAIEDNNPDNYDRKIAFQKHLDDVCDGIILGKMKKKKKSMTLKKVKELTKLDWFMSGETAIKNGLADSVE